MEDVMYTNLLKTISLVAGIVGILLGLDLIFGAPVITILKRVFDKKFDFDKMITDPKVRRGFGIILLALSLIIILLIRTI